MGRSANHRGKLQLFVGIDRMSKLAFVRLETEATRMIACQFLRDLIDAFGGQTLPGAFPLPPQPYRLHTTLTDTKPSLERQVLPPVALSGRVAARLAGHLFDRICAEHGPNTD